MEFNIFSTFTIDRGRPGDQCPISAQARTQVRSAVHTQRRHGGYHPTCDKCGFLAVRRKKMKSHIETVHGDGDFTVKITWALNYSNLTNVTFAIRLRI